MRKPTDRTPRIKHVMDLKPNYDGLRAVQLRRSNGFVICEVYNGTSSALVSVPQYAYDVVTPGNFSTVREIKEYIRTHPQPSPL